MAVALPLQTRIQTANVQSTPDVIRINFGGGYSQRVGRGGFNNIKETMSVLWVGLTRAQMRDLQTALQSKQGLELFSYVADNSTETKYWSVQDVSSGEPRESWDGTERLWNMSANFNREYDIIV